jgi:hypothetical protein
MNFFSDNFDGFVTLGLALIAGACYVVRLVFIHLKDHNKSDIRQVYDSEKIHRLENQVESIKAELDQFKLHNPQQSSVPDETIIHQVEIIIQRIGNVRGELNPAANNQIPTFNIEDIQITPIAVHGEGESDLKSFRNRLPRMIEVS